MEFCYRSRLGKVVLGTVVVFAVFFWQVADSQADIVLNVDVATKTLFFSGSDTGQLQFQGNGNPADSGGVYWVNAGGGPRFSIDIESDVNWSGVGTPSNELNTNTIDLYGGQFVGFNILGGGGASGTLSFDGTLYSYAGASLTQQANLELQIGTSLILLSGSPGFSRLRIEAATFATPEPSSFIMMIMAFASFCPRRKR